MNEDGEALEIKQMEVSIACEDGWIGHMWVTALGSNLYQLEHATVFGEAIDYKDIIEAELKYNTLIHPRLVKKSEFERFDYILSISLIESKQFEVFLERVIDQKGWWERVFGGLVLIFLLPNSEIDPTKEIENFIEELERIEAGL